MTKDCPNFDVFLTLKNVRNLCLNQIFTWNIKSCPDLEQHSLSLSSTKMGQATILFSLLLVLVVVKGSIFNHPRPRSSPSSPQSVRKGKQVESASGGIDFTGCVTNQDTGLCCIEKTESVSSLKKEPILECTHKNTEQCHYTYVTQFKPSVEEICEETFEKQCQITFKKQAFNETVEHCYRPIEKVCNGQGPEQCSTVYESSCTTKYVEKQPGKFVGDTGCEKLPVEICGAGCLFEEGVEECHEKVLTSIVDVPEEVCDLNPQKICKFVTKLVPKLSPVHECTIVPKETCHIKFTQPKQVEKPLQTRWCLDPTPAAPGESYDENDALGSPIGRR